MKNRCGGSQERGSDGSVTEGWQGTRRGSGTQITIFQSPQRQCRSLISQTNEQNLSEPNKPRQIILFYVGHDVSKCHVQ